MMGKQAAGAGDSGLSNESKEGEILNLDSLNLDSEQTLCLKLKLESSLEGGKIVVFDSEEGGQITIVDSEEIVDEDHEMKILTLDSEEDRKILMKVKSEEGKILKLKKEYMAASEAALAGISTIIDPMPMVKPPSKMKTKKKVVVKTLVPPEYIALIKAMPCPVTSPEMNLVSEEDLADLSQSIKDYYRLRTTRNMKMRDYHQALVEQYDKFGFAVDETEFIVVNEDEDEENAVNN